MSSSNKIWSNKKPIKKKKESGLLVRRTKILAREPKILMRNTN